MFEITDENGCVLCNNYIPEELMSIILSYVSPTDLVFVCRRVCKYWRQIIDSQVWKIKLARENLPVRKIQSLPWFACFWVLLKSPLSRNLLKNNCGQVNEKIKILEGFFHWDIINVLIEGGNGWKIEQPPVGCEEFPKQTICKDMLKYNSCFATTFFSCNKMQLINLTEEGAIPEFMDNIQPHIEIVDWYCGRFDCRAIYELKVRLLNEKYESLDNFEFKKHVGAVDGCSWQKVSHIFQEYGHGVRYIDLCHGGKDLQFWAGHYGSKMTNTLVSLSLPQV